MNNPGDLLDEVAVAVFGGRDGPGRVQPLLASWDASVGPSLDDDPLRAVLHAIRTDWALCDALAEAGADLGDTWIHRVLDGKVAGVEPKPQWSCLRRNHVGLFEVWSQPGAKPGRRLWLRDLRAGFCVALRDPPWVQPFHEGAFGPAALWEARVLLDGGEAYLCRPPLAYPLLVRDQLAEHNRVRFGRGGEPFLWAVLRRRWQQFQRAGRADPRVIFKD